MHLSCFVHMHACRNIADVVTDHIGDGHDDDHIGDGHDDDHIGDGHDHDHIGDGHDDDHIGDVMAYCTCAW